MSRLTKYVVPVLAAGGLLATGAPASATVIAAPTLDITVNQPSAYTGHTVTFTGTVTDAPKKKVLVQVVSGPNVGKTRTMISDSEGNLKSVGYIGTDIPDTATDQVRFCVDSAPANNVCDSGEATETVGVSWFAAPRMIFDHATVAFPGNQHLVVSGTLFCSVGSAMSYTSHVEVNWIPVPKAVTLIQYFTIGAPADCTSQSNGFGMTVQTPFAQLASDGSHAALSIQALDGDAGDTMGVSATRNGADSPLFNVPQKALSKGSITYFVGSAPSDN